jgi:hypothetical protein
MANTQLAQQIADNQHQAATTQLALRNNRRVIRRPGVGSSAINNSATDSLAEQHDDFETDGGSEAHAHAHAGTEAGTKTVPGIVMAPNFEQPHEPAIELMPSSSATPDLIQEPTKAIARRKASNVVPLPNSGNAVSPMDLPTDHFSAALNRRKQNRQLLMEWLRSSLVNGIDYGSIHVVGRDRCQLTQMGRMNDCKEASHWSKPCLFKPGAEKITGMLGMTVNFPSLPDYEAAVFGDVPITVIVMRCELRDAHGHVVAEGVGARNLSQDFGDINKSFKMVEKSAHIDATLRLAGLSEMFTQDLDDKPPPGADTGCEEPAFSSSMTKGRSTSSASSPASKPPLQSTSSPTARRVVIQPKQSPADAAEKPVQETGEPLVSKADLVALRKAITKHGFTERRVLSWVMKFTHGAVTNFEQLPTALCESLLKRLEHWAEAEFFQSTGGTTTNDNQQGA